MDSLLKMVATSLARHALTAVGAAMIEAGYLNDMQWVQIAGGLTAAGAVLWSYWQKQKMADHVDNLKAQHAAVVDNANRQLQAAGLKGLF